MSHTPTSSRPSACGSWVTAPWFWTSATPAIPDRRGTWSTSSISATGGRRSRRPRTPSRSSMADRLRRVAVLTGAAKEATGAALKELAAARERLGVELLMPADEAARHDAATALGYALVDEAALRAADVCLVFGGDGTILRALGRLLASPVPTLGVNYGNVGFLAALGRDDWGSGLESILGGEHRVVELLTVDVQVNGRSFTAVNDVILSRVAPRHVLQLEYDVAVHD